MSALKARERALSPANRPPQIPKGPIQPQSPWKIQPSKNSSASRSAKPERLGLSDIFLSRNLRNYISRVRIWCERRLNHDGIPDLILTVGCYFSCTSGTNSGAVAVLLGNGDGTYKAPLCFSALRFSLRMAAVGDFNNDGNVDVAVLSFCYLQVSGCQGALAILLGNGDGTFQTPNVYLAQLDSFYMTVADFNGDGRLDVAVVNALSNPPAGTPPISIFLGNGDGTLQSPGIVSAYAGGIAAADVNGDGFADLLVLSGGVNVMLSNGDGTFQSAVTYSNGIGTGI